MLGEDCLPSQGPQGGNSTALRLRDQSRAGRGAQGLGGSPQLSTPQQSSGPVYPRRMPAGECTGLLWRHREIALWGGQTLALRVHGSGPGTTGCLLTAENEAKPVAEGPGQLPSLEDSTGVEAEGPFQGRQPSGQQQGRGLCLTHAGTGTQVPALPLAPKRLTAQWGGHTHTADPWR